MKELNSKPEFVRRSEELRRERARIEDSLAKAEYPLIKALHGAGQTVGSVWELVNSREAYAAAIPVLLEHLRGAYPDRIREGIARALAVPDSRPFLHSIVAMYRSESSPEVKDGLAAAVAGATTKGDIELLLGLLRDKSLGPSRVLLLPSLLRWADGSVDEYLGEFVRDLDLAAEVVAMQKQLKRPRK